MACGFWSFRMFTSIDVNPKTALVTCPDAVARSVGSAKNARYVSELPSIRRTADAAPSALGLGRQVARDHLVGHRAHRAPILHGPLLDPREGVGLR